MNFTFIWGLVQVLGVLIFLTGIMYGVLYLMRKYLFAIKGSGVGNKLGNSIEVVTTQIIMPKKYISIVKIRDRVYILGITDQNITLLDSVDEEEMPEEVLEEMQKQTPNFVDYIKKSFGGRQ